MNYAQLRNRITLWPHMHFSGALYEVREGLYEVYATDTSHEHVSRIFLICLTDAHQAGAMCAQVTTWLARINLGKDDGESVVVQSAAGRVRSGKQTRV